MDVEKFVDKKLDTLPYSDDWIHMSDNAPLFVDIIQAALDQDRREREGDDLSVKLIKLAKNTNEGTKWIWLDVGLTLVDDDVFGLASDTPLAAVDVALEEAKKRTDSP